MVEDGVLNDSRIGKLLKANNDSINAIEVKRKEPIFGIFGGVLKILYEKNKLWHDIISNMDGFFFSEKTIISLSSGLLFLQCVS